MEKARETKSRLAQQQRGLHTLQRPHLQQQSHTSQQRRSLYLQQIQSFNLLKERNIPVRESNDSDAFFLGIAVDRTAHSPSVIASPTVEPIYYMNSAVRVPFEYGEQKFPVESATIKTIAKHLRLETNAQTALSELTEALVDIFMTKEAFSLETRVCVTANGTLEVQGARFGFDDAAYRSANRQEAIHKLRNRNLEVPEEVEAEKDGIVYVK